MLQIFYKPISQLRWQLAQRRSPRLTINLSNFTQTPQSATPTAPLQGSQGGFFCPWVDVGIDPYDFDIIGVAVHGCGLRLERSRNLATVHGFMILYPSWYRENIGIILQAERNGIKFILNV